MGIEATPLDVGGGPWPRLVGRLRVAPRVLQARKDVAHAIGVEQRALAALGDAIASAKEPFDPGLDSIRAEIAELDSRRDGLEAALAASLQEDRADYAAVAAWIRPLVIARGLASRSILRHRLGRLRGDREAVCLRLGTASARAPMDLPAGARSRIGAASSEEELLLAPVGGFLLPGPARVALGEARAFGQAVLREARSQLVPRVPALFGLAAGWWVTRTFTDSWLTGTLHSLGIGSGRRRVVDHGTLRILGFALPLLAAAACSYLSARLASLVRARYGKDI
jgi:hypothetical protein